MIVSQMIYHTDDGFFITFKEFETNNRLMIGIIKELEAENNKAYKRIKARQIKDFSINNGTLTIWI